MPTITNDPTTLILFVALLVGILSLSVGLRKFQETGAFFVLSSDRWKTERKDMSDAVAKSHASLEETVRQGFADLKEHLATKADVEATKGRIRRLEAVTPKPSGGFFSDSDSGWQR